MWVSSNLTTAKAVNDGTSAEPFFHTYSRSMIVPIVVFFALQRYFVRGLLARFELRLDADCGEARVRDVQEDGAATLVVAPDAVERGVRLGSTQAIDDRGEVASISREHVALVGLLKPRRVWTNLTDGWLFALVSSILAQNVGEKSHRSDSVVDRSGANTLPVRGE